MGLLTCTDHGEDGWHSTTDSTGAYLIDRSPDYFEQLLNFLRHGKLLYNEGINPRGIHNIQCSFIDIISKHRYIGRG